MNDLPQTPYGLSIVHQIKVSPALWDKLSTIDSDQVFDAICLRAEWREARGEKFSYFLRSEMEINEALGRAQ